MIVLHLRDSVVRHLPFRAPEWWMSGMLLQFGVKLLWPGSTFASSSSYDVMAEMGRVAVPWLDPELTWGWFAVLVASVRIFALTANGHVIWFRRYSPGARCLGAFLSALAWFAISTGILAANSRGTGAGTYYGLMIADIIMAVVVSGEAGRAFWRPRNGRS